MAEQSNVLAGQLRQALAAEGAAWRVSEHLADSDAVPVHGLGGTSDGLVQAPQAAPVDFRALLHVPPVSPFLAQRAVARGLAEETRLGPGSEGTATASASVPPSAAGAPPAAVDWRSRWGWPWITSIRNQDGCEACWAFAAVALIEAMARVEHCCWPHYSEGDVHKGIGAKCANTGGIQAAVDWIRTHGLCDPQCFAWTTSDIAYAPTGDRSGRTVRGSLDAMWVGSVADQKNWLDTVGPLGTFFEVWHDFDGYGGGVYKRSTSPQNYDRGGHFMLVVGYDDTQGAWIVKNSWGAGWGASGYALIGYGEADIDTYAKLGVRHLNPDPWTKRRLHSGNMIESGNGGTYRNFEMLSRLQNGQVQHWWRDNSASGFPWHKAYAPFAGDAGHAPTLTSTTYNRNFECVYTRAFGQLHHWWFDQGTSHWKDGGIFGPADAFGVPGFIQGNYGAPGNFEVVVRTTDGRLNHWWRSGGVWHDGGRFGQNVLRSGASLVQSHYENKGNFELVCVLNGGSMQHWWRDNDGGNKWHAAAQFGSGCTSGPCMIEGQFGAGTEEAVGNFELCVAVGGHVQHWWRNNHGDMKWRQSATFGHDVLSVEALIQSSFGFNLEMVVLRNDHSRQHYWRDNAGWHEGAVVA